MDRWATAGHCFAFSTCAAPAAVWQALTRGGCFPGLTLASDWTAGSPLLVTAAGSTSPAGIGGAVLLAVPPARLSYYFQAAPGDPCTYLTWQVRPAPCGSVVKLHVDEVECPDDEAGAEETWLPLLAALQVGLAAA